MTLVLEQFILLCLSKSLYNRPLGLCGCICSKDVKMAQIQHCWGPRAATHAYRMHSNLFIISLAFQWCCCLRPLGLDDTANPLITEWYVHIHLRTYHTAKHLVQLLIQHQLFSQTRCSSEDTDYNRLLCFGIYDWIDRICMQDGQTLTGCLMGFEVMKKLPYISCHDLKDRCSLIYF